jgi:hypothetical protein
MTVMYDKQSHLRCDSVSSGVQEPAASIFIIRATEDKGGNFLGTHLCLSAIQHNMTYQKILEGFVLNFVFCIYTGSCC